MALADTSDLANRMGPLTGSQAARAEALLEDASALVLGWVTPSFTQVDDTVDAVPVAGEIVLPETPVIAVTGVTAIGRPPSADIALTTSEWSFDGSKTLTVIQSTPSGAPPGWSPLGSFRVTYSHGYTAVPADVIAVVCRMVMRVLTSPTPASGMVGEQIGQVSYQMQQGIGSAGSSPRFYDSDKKDLRHYRRQSTTVRTPVAT